MLKKITIPVDNPSLTREGVRADLEAAFPNYKCRLFGIGPGKRIIVEKSATIGASVSLGREHIEVNVARPSILAGALLNASLGLAGLLLMKKCNPIVDEVGDYLKIKYGTVPDLI